MAFNKKDDQNNISEKNRLFNPSNSLEQGVIKLFRAFFNLIDKYIFNVKHTGVVAFILAVLLFISVNYDSSNSLFGSPLLSSRTVENVTVNASYNKEAFEVSGLPSSVSVVVSGDSSAVISATNGSGYVSANLEGLTEGTHNVQLVPEGFSDNVSIAVNPSNVTVTLKAKSTLEFDLGYDFVNTSKMEAIYALGTPSFEVDKVNVRASKDTLNSIAFVKALIDVSGVDSDFTQDAILVAYDQNGQPVDAQIVPETVSVTVPVTSPSKTVPIVVDISGEVSDGMAIESIEMDNSTVTIYGSESVLSRIENVVVSLDASTISKDGVVLRPITLPSGVTQSSINQVNLDITLAQSSSKVIEGVAINYRNNTNGYRISAEGYQSNVAVTVYGTQTNIDQISADQISAYIDFTNVEPGVNELAIQLETPSNSYVKYELSQQTITVNVLGDSDSGSSESEEQG